MSAIIISMMCLIPGDAFSNDLIGSIENILIDRIISPKNDQIYIVPLEIEPNGQAKNFLDEFEDPIELNKNDRALVLEGLQTIKFNNSKTIRALEDSYILFLFEGGNHDGIALHYSINHGLDSLRVFPAKKLNKTSMAIDGYITLTSLDREGNGLLKGKGILPDYNIRVPIVNGWRLSGAHRRLMQVIHEHTE